MRQFIGVVADRGEGGGGKGGSVGSKRRREKDHTHLTDQSNRRCVFADPISRQTSGHCPAPEKQDSKEVKTGSFAEKEKQLRKGQRKRGGGGVVGG